MALPIWEQYAENHELTYRDTVIGLTHSVDPKLMEVSIESIEDSRAEFGENEENKLTALYDQFREPVVALQDGDWELPYEVETAFYSVYNLIRNTIGKKTTFSNESMIYVSVNQAADALTTSKMLTFDEINEILFEISKS